MTRVVLKAGDFCGATTRGNRRISLGDSRHRRPDGGRGRLRNVRAERFESCDFCIDALIIIEAVRIHRTLIISLMTCRSTVDAALAPLAATARTIEVPMTAQPKPGQPSRDPLSEVRTALEFFSFFFLFFIFLFFFSYFCRVARGLSL